MNNTSGWLFILWVDLTHLGWDQIAAISQTTFWNAFSWMKMYEFCFKISLKFVPKFWVNNIPALIQIMAWHWPGNNWQAIIWAHICVTWPQWVNIWCTFSPLLRLIITPKWLSYTSSPRIELEFWIKYAEILRKVFQCVPMKFNQCTWQFYWK